MTNPWDDWSWAIDGWIVVVGALCAAAAALIGNFLVLRRMSLMGDAISHAVLPGLAVAFLLTHSRASLPMFVGAAVVGVLTAFFTEWIRSYGRVESGAAMGVVFTALFAVGLILIVQTADRIDLDPKCVLYGAIAGTPFDLVTLGGVTAPRAAWVLAGTLVLNALCVTLFYKELKISAFDPALATSLGINAVAMHYLLMTLVAITSVASFESVGNILVVAMFVVPPATARLLTDRLRTMILLSLLLAVAAAVLGHLGAMLPKAFGLSSTRTAGMMAVATGGLFAIAVAFAPRQGLVMRWRHGRRLAVGIATEDILGRLYRAEEKAARHSLPIAELAAAVASPPRILRRALKELAAAGSITLTADACSLTRPGRAQAAELVRSHRLWETYMGEHFHLPADHVHDPAEQIEHYLGPETRRELATELQHPATDPQGHAIPPETREE